MIKNFFLSSGEKLINILAVISLIIIFFIGIAASMNTRNFGEGLLAFILVEIIGFAYVVLIFYFLYLLMDIRDILKKIEENTKNKV